MEKAYVVLNERKYVKKTLMHFKSIIDLKVGISTFQDFDWHFNVFKRFLFSKNIDLEKNDGLMMFFISSKKMSNEFVGSLLDDCFINTLHIKDEEEITSLMEKGWQKISLDNLLINKSTISKKLKV